MLSRAKKHLKKTLCHLLWILLYRYLDKALSCSENIKVLKISKIVTALQIKAGD